MNVNDIVTRLSGVTRTRSGYKARCPAHDDQEPSLSVEQTPEGRILLHCFAGCSFDAVLNALGLTASDLSPPARGSQARVVATYDYTDARGNLLYQVVRFDPKGFKQRKPDGHGGWTWKLENVKRVLYKLPALAEAVAEGRLIFLVEGEKDADRLAASGLAATTAPGGAGKWRAEYAEFLRGAKIAILPDNDGPGRAHAEAAARTLHGKVAELKIVELPDLPPKGDVSTWLDGGGTAERLLQLVAAAPAWTPPNGSNNSTPAPGNGVFTPTDLGNARRLIARHGQDLRFCHPWRRWLVWHNARWQEDDTAEIRRRFLDTLKAMYVEASQTQDDDSRKALINHALKSESRARVDAAISLAEALEGVPVLPRELDADPWLLNVRNGTLDLRTGQLRPHRREDLLTKQVPVAYDPDAKCPAWENFLERILAGDHELISFIQRAVGYSLTGDTCEQVLFFLHGTGANGKTTFLETLRALLGDYAMQADFDTFLHRDRSTIPNGLARLRGARLVTACEVGDGKRFAEALIKQATGGDTIAARKLYEEFFEFKPEFKLWLAANHRPRIQGTDHAIWRRIRLIPFVVSIPPEEQDRNLALRLRAELPGILTWAVRGCAAWQASGLGLPAAVKVATDSYREEQDVLAQFLQERCTTGALMSTPAKALYKAYAAWCEANNERPLSQRALGMKLAERGFVRSRRGDSGAWTWLGLGLSSNTEDFVTEIF